MGPQTGRAPKVERRKMKFTKHEIEKLECPAEKKDFLRFESGKGAQLGFGVRVTRGAKRGDLANKFFLAQYPNAGEKRRLPLGACSAISIAAARDAVRAIVGDVAKGRDPARERKDAAREAKRKAVHEALTVETLVEQWKTLGLVDRRERYVAEAVRALRYAFASHLKRPAAELSRGAAVRVLDSLANDGKNAMASRTSAYGRACYQWAVKRGSLSTNPFQDLPLAPAVKRERVLADEELCAIWRATEIRGSFNAIVRELILTGQRREEVAAMTWGEIAPDLSTWTIPGTKAKNGAAHLVPLSSQAQTILRAAPHIEGNDLVFPGLRGPFNGFSKAKSVLDKTSGVKDWRLHDLRRTLATGLQKLGVRLEVTEAVLNHVSGSRAGIVGVYQRHNWADEKRAALNAWGAHVAALVDERAAQANVIPLQRA
jgi:integrase